MWVDVIHGASIGIAGAVVALNSRSENRLRQIARGAGSPVPAPASQSTCHAAAGATETTADPAWLADVRAQLPLTEQLVYLQTGGHGPALDSVLTAAAAAAADDAHNGMEVMTGVRPAFFKSAGLGSGASGVAAAEARKALGVLLGCPPESVAVLSSTSVALYTVIMARQWDRGDELIISNLVISRLFNRNAMKLWEFPLDVD